MANLWVISGLGWVRAGNREIYGNLWVGLGSSSGWAVGAVQGGAEIWVNLDN
jgi:hypothetical protein